jgi:acyl-CoA thioesterase
MGVRPVSSGPSRFERDTAVTATGDGPFRARIDPAWWIVNGPNGGYVAAIVLRAVVAAVGDPVRRPRSATFHYLRPPSEGEVEVDVTLEREGRTVTNASARMVQGGRTLVLALVALGLDRDAPVSYDEDPGLPRTERGEPVPTWSELPPGDVDPERDIPMRAQYDMRWALGDPPFRPGPRPRSRCGGWLRLLEHTEVDEVVLVAMADAWLPPIFSREAVALGVPTVDLTVHLRGRPPAGETWCFAEFASPVARDGYVVEHGALRDATGRLLADVRQLAVLT